MNVQINWIWSNFVATKYGDSFLKKYQADMIK